MWAKFAKTFLTFCQLGKFFKFRQEYQIFALLNGQFFKKIEPKTVIKEFAPPAIRDKPTYQKMKPKQAVLVARVFRD